MNSERCSQCKHFIIANAGEGKIYGCDRSKCVFEPTTKNDLGVQMTNGEKMQEIFPEGKTRKCRDGVVLESDGWCHAYDSDWWNAEYKEPTTKKCTTCAYRAIDGKPHEMCKSCVCGDRYREEPTTRNCFGCKYSKDNHRADTEECHLCMWENQYTPNTKNDLPNCQHTDEEIAKSFIEDVEAVKDQLHCGEQMDFPSTFDEFAKDYGFKDKKEIYTNGSELISVFRVKQWLEHISTTKNDLGVDCISRAEVLKLMQDNWHTHNGDWAMQESMDDIRALPSVAPQKSTTKNGLGVDCIDRNSIKYYPGTGGYMYASKGEIDKLPPITPQEPRKGHWKDIPKYKDIAWYCSECERFTTMKHNYCPKCGAKMVEPQESEDKE